MVLELYVWGPAFGLPSIDPECLAAVAYLSLAAPRQAWTVVTTSPSAVQHPLPALRDVQSGCWVASGFEALVAYLRSCSSSSTFLDLDAGLTPVQVADTTAYSAFLRADAAPMLALSLYVSSANWAAATRPAYSRLLPFPLTWLEPPALRAARSACAAHLDLSYLDTDADGSGTTAAALGEEAEPSPLTAALNAFPNRLRPSLRPTVAALSGASQTPEARAQARLDAAARACLDVLAKRKGRKRLFLQGQDEGDVATDKPATQRDTEKEDEKPTSLDCLAFGYLALMAVPAVPRPFLRDALHRHHLGLAVFVADMRRLCADAEGSGTGMTSLWQQKKQPVLSSEAASTSSSSSSLTVATRPALRPLWLRTVAGLVHSVPGVGGACLVWLWQELGMTDAEDEEDGVDDKTTTARRRRGLLQRLLVLGAATLSTALAVGLVSGYRRLPPFGAPMLVYRPVPRTLVGMGMAGAMLSML